MKRFIGGICGSLKQVALSAVIVVGMASASSAQELTFASGSVGGAYFMVSSLFAEYIKKEMPGVGTTVIPGGGWANVEHLQSGLADVGIVENVLSTLAAKGESPTGEQYDFRMLAGVRGPSIWQAAIPASRGITSLEQIAEEKLPVRIALHEPAQLVVPMALDALAEYGITADSLREWGGQLVHTSMEEGIRMINDGQLDIWITGGSGYPHPRFIEMGSREPFVLLGLSEEVAKRVADKYGAGYGEVEADIYADANGTNEPYYSPMLVVGFGVRTDLDEDLVYQLTDALAKNKEAFWAEHEQNKFYQPETAWRHVGATPLHPGAERWYREHGHME